MDVIFKFGTDTTLEAAFPMGTDRYLALLHTMPDSAGAGAVEASYSGYARIAYKLWFDEDIEGVTHRSNTNEIKWAVLPSDLEFQGLGFYDALTVGNLLFAMDLRPILRMKINAEVLIQERFLKMRLDAEDVDVPNDFHIAAIDNALTYLGERFYTNVQDLFPDGKMWPKDPL